MWTEMRYANQRMGGAIMLTTPTQDDEITIPELDFALKAVNYNLISDAEMTYVHNVSIL